MKSGIFKTLFVALLLAFSPVAASAQSADLDSLFEQLADPATQDWQKVESQIWLQWSLSGSSAMDLLLIRGRRAMQAGDLQGAIEHLTALTENAPNFAEGWNARATAYFQAGLFGPSIQDIQRTLALNPRHFGALSGLGMIFEQMDRPKDALKAYQAAVAIHPKRTNLIDAVKRLEVAVGDTEL
ncbi:MAG: tetratricopeptide repeat protein [Paracoccaceae bacterium]